MYKAFTDGGKEPGTGMTTIGGIIFCGEREVCKYYEKGTEGNNNEAEFLSLIKCIELGIEHGITEITVNVDAQILVDALKDNTVKVEELITKLASSKNDNAKMGIAKALSKITKQQFGTNVNAWIAWLSQNQ